jgi:pimeloyl-ACP methyl ester carboxylesterase
MTRKLFNIVAIALIAATLGFYAYTQLSRYPAAPPAQVMLAQATPAPRGWLVFGEARANGKGLILYPGGLVDARAYAPIAQAISERGYLVVVIPVPLELAFFDQNAAARVIGAYPQVKTWAVGGHSLGGVVAEGFVRANAGPEGKATGLVLWASYAQGDLSTLPVKAISIRGSNDGLLASRSEAELRKGLPADAQFVVIAGGNHSMFGDYGEQARDNPPGRSYVELRKEIVDETAKFLSGL